jgi:hypothetical protein
VRDHLERWSANELRDLGELHAATGEATARLAAQRAGSSDLARLEQHIEALLIAGSPSARAVADSRFHIELAAASHSNFLTRSETEVQAQVVGLVWALVAEADVADRVAAASRAHTAIVTALRRGRPEAAAKTLRAHLRDESEILVAARLRMYPRSTSGRARSLEGVARVARRVARDAFSIAAEVRDEVLNAWARRDRTPIDPRSLDALARLSMSRVGTGPRSVDGLGVAFLPEIAAPRWAWWSATERGPAPLAVDLDPRHPDYYDYATAEWFTTPLRRSALSVAGPFVDLACANEQICTFAAPIISRDGTSLGVAGADVAVQRLEGAVVPALRQLRDRAALLNSAGIIIASNSGDLQPGSQSANRSSGSARSDDEAVLVDASTRWWVCRFS